MARGLSISALRTALQAGRVEWQRHALERMVERDVASTEVMAVVLEGECIEDYPSAYPQPAALFLGWCSGRPLHVVVAFDQSEDMAYVITVYEPSVERFGPGFRTRRNA